jgi:hypothetical protein
MIPGYIDTYRQLEIVYEKKILQQAKNYATHSEHYSKEKLSEAMQMLRAAKNLKMKMIECNLKWAAERKAKQQNKYGIHS